MNKTVTLSIAPYLAMPGRRVTVSQRGGHAVDQAHANLLLDRIGQSLPSGIDDKVGSQFISGHHIPLNASSNAWTKRVFCSELPTVTRR